MTGPIAIDESGVLGQNGSRYFLMAAIITGRSKTFRKAYKIAPTSSSPEIKFYNAKPREHINVLEEVAKADDISTNVGKNVKDCKKGAIGRCTGIADYIVGAVRMKYENKNSELFEIIKEKISTAREPLGPR